MRALGGVAEELDPAEAARRWPGVATSDLARVVLEPAGGFGRPALACRTIARAALATGLVEPVAALAERVGLSGGRAAGLIVRERDASLRVIEADAVVVAAGFAGVALVSEYTGDLGIRRLPHWTSYWDVPYPDGANLAVEGLYFVGGMSGHGFKHAPSLGESVAQLVVGETPAIDLAPYRVRT